MNKDLETLLRKILGIAVEAIEMQGGTTEHICKKEMQEIEELFKKLKQG